MLLLYDAFGSQWYVFDGTSTITAGDGLDTLYGTDAVADTFVFESASAFNDIDEIISFKTSDGDAIDISDLIVGAFSGTITDYVQFVDSGTDTIVQVDANGLTGGSSYSSIAQIDNITGLDEATLYTDGNIII